MAKKYHWSYERAMELVDAWLEEHGITLPDLGDAYEALVESMANEIEQQKASGHEEGYQEGASAARSSSGGGWVPIRPNHWLRTGGGCNAGPSVEIE